MLHLFHLRHESSHTSYFAYQFTFAFCTIETYPSKKITIGPALIRLPIKFPLTKGNANFLKSFDIARDIPNYIYRLRF